MKDKLVIGRKDLIDLPDLGLHGIPAKVDTGAYTSSIHCKKIKVKDGALHFTLRSPDGQKHLFQFRDFTQKTIRSSNGEAQKRFVIKTKILIFNKSYKIQFSLSDRSKMKNPVLLGRRFLTGKFVVDVSKQDLSVAQKLTI